MTMHTIDNQIVTNRNGARGRAGTVAAALLACLLSATSASAQTSGFVYALVGNTNAPNTVVGFAVDSNGNLTALPGFPILTGGNGYQYSSNLALSLWYDAANSRLYAVNTGSNTVSAWTVNTLTGALTPMPFSPLALPNVIFPIWHCVVTNPSGSVLIIGDGNGGRLASYVMTASTATAAAGSPFPSEPSIVSSCAFSQDGAYYYSGGGNGNLFAGHSVNQSSGVLTLLPGSPYDAVFGEPIGFQIDSSGRFFVKTFWIQGALVYTTPAGVPTGVAGNPFASALAGVKHGLIHPAGFYVTTSDYGYVEVFRINGSGSATTLSLVAGSPFATGGVASRISLLDGTDNLVVTANTASRNATVFRFNPTTGALTLLRITPVNSFGSTGQIDGLAWAAACNALPSITAQPASQTIAAGGHATLSVTASGCVPSSYQWYQGVSGGAANPIGGATASSYVTPSLDAQTNYWVSVSNMNGSTFSNTANISVQFTDPHSANPTLTTGLTIVLAGHIVNLRDRINAILTAHGQAPMTWAETLTAQMTAIKASHVNELRNAILTLYAALGLPAPTFLYSPVAVGDVIRARTISELRGLVTAVE
jgi:hypothetical protein